MTEQAEEQVEAQGPRIVVGVDGSQGSKAALAWAMTQARLSGTSVEAVTAWQDPLRAGYGFAYGWSPAPMDDGAMRDIAVKTLDAAITEVAGTRDDQVEIRARVVPGHPVDVLLEIAASADLLVLGTRGHNPFTGTLLGSVSQHCVQHAPCPVVVVPAVPDRTAPDRTAPDDTAPGGTASDTAAPNSRTTDEAGTAS